MKKQNTNSKTFTLVGLAILTAIIIVLQVVTTYFPTKPFAITLALIPIVTSPTGWKSARAAISPMPPQTFNEQTRRIRASFARHLSSRPQ